MADKKEKSKCRINTHAGSEIPELGLDVARLKLNCHLNPARVADAAVRVAKTYGKYRHQKLQEREKRRGPYNKAGSTIRGKRTRIIIDKHYVDSKGDDEPVKEARSPKQHHHQDNDDEDEDDD